jgi:DeoR family transcriptional regulator, fructose operon transcriptional repressor
MYAAERHQVLVRRARELGRLEVTQVAAELGVTTETIRRDPTALERQGLLHRVHGGSIATDRVEIEPAVGVREVTHAEKKDRIAKAAVAELGSATTILLDAGTTARVASLLPDDVELTVVTNSLPIATALASRSRVTVDLIGGRVRGTTMSAVDRWALTTLESVNCDVAVPGTNGFSVDRGLTTPDLAESAVKGAMVAAAARRIVVADSSKYGVDSAIRAAGPELVVT